MRVVPVTSTSLLRQEDEGEEELPVLLGGKSHACEKDKIEARRSIQNRGNQVSQVRMAIEQGSEPSGPSGRSRLLISALLNEVA